MRGRDEFPIEVKRKLAERAGHTCAVCEKSTSGPGSDRNTSLSDGIAAHITAASKGGPRFDPTLSPRERSSIQNGIWACTQHGRLIDSDHPDYTVDLLRGLKRRQEDLAKLRFERKSRADDRSSVLVDLPHAYTAYKLFEIIAPQDYTFTTLACIRDFISLAPQRSQILTLASEVIVSTWDTHPNVAGILATLLSNNIDIWDPTSAELGKLEQLCTKAISVNDWSQVAAVEPLAFAIFGKGLPNVHRNILERLINTTSWRNADVDRIRRYYGTIGNQVAAIFRHWRDEFRGGLLRANDAGRLIDLLLSSDQVLQRPSTRQSLLELLESHAVLLRDSGELQLAQSVMEFTLAFRSLKTDQSL
jgi:hypothetical protein